MIVRTSHALCFDECPHKYKLKYLNKIRARFQSANLVFGTVFHKVFTDYVKDCHESPDQSHRPEDHFLQLWCHTTENTALDYSANWSSSDLKECGYSLSKKIPDAWENSGLYVAADSGGLLIERRLSTQISDDLFLSGQPDLIVMNSNLEVGPVDLKTTISDYSDIFVYSSEQLIDYQILIDENAEEIGLGNEAVSFVGFIEAIKRKKPKTNRGRNPEIKSPLLSARRNFDAVDERKEKLKWMHEDIKNARFPKRPKMAYNSPCEICEYRFLCHEGSMHNLIHSQS